MQRLDFLCVLAGPRRIAVPLNLVLSVEEAGPLTPLPFSPPLVEGLVMALGRVLPQMPLAAVLGEESRDGGVLVVLASRDDVRALRVDQVAGMVQVDVEFVQTIDNIERAEQPLVSARFAALDAEWSVLDYGKLTAEQPMETETTEGAALVGVSREETTVAPASVDSGEHLPLLHIEVSGESYALPIAEIVEILVSGLIRSMPAAPAWVAGLTDRRGTPLLVVSAAALLGRPPTCELSTVLVIEMPGAGEIGIAIDRAVGIERAHQTEIHAVTQDMPGVTRYFVLAREHIVGIIDSASLIGQVRDTVTALIPRREQPADNIPAAETGKSSRKLLSVRVGRELLALPLERVRADSGIGAAHAIAAAWDRISRHDGCRRCRRPRPRSAPAYCRCRLGADTAMHVGANRRRTRRTCGRSGVAHRGHSRQRRRRRRDPSAVTCFSCRPFGRKSVVCPGDRPRVAADRRGDVGRSAGLNHHRAGSFVTSVKSAYHFHKRSRGIRVMPHVLARRKIK